MSDVPLSILTHTLSFLKSKYPNAQISNTNITESKVLSSFPGFRHQILGTCTRNGRTDNNNETRMFIAAQFNMLIQCNDPDNVPDTNINVSNDSNDMFRYNSEYVAVIIYKCSNNNSLCQQQ